MSFLVLICTKKQVPWILQYEIECQKWNGENTKAVDTPFEKLKDRDKDLYLAQYNRKPTAIVDDIRRIKSFNSNEKFETTGFKQGKWVTVATLPHTMFKISVISLESEDLLIIAFKNNIDSAEIKKLHDGKITHIGTFNEVFVT